jgi:hypothetical protein
MSYYPVSLAFERALRSGSHTMISRLDVEQGDVVSSFDFIDGEVTIDFDDRTRRSLDCEIVDPQSRIYDVMRGLIDPYLSVVRPYRGIKFTDGSTELVPLGVFYPDQVSAGEGSNGAVTWKIRAFDASIRAQDELGQAMAVVGGTLYTSAVKQVIRRVYPNASFSLGNSRFATPTLVVDEQTIPWTWAQDLGRDYGEDLTVDRDGIFTSAPRILQTADAPVWTFAEGEGATSWEPERTIDADKPVNVVEVIGTNSGAPGVYGIAFDNDKSSPTYRYGPNGERKRTFRSEKVITTAQANAAARFLLSKLLGKTDQVTLKAIPHPALDVGDTVAAYRSRLGLVGDRLLVSHIELPLTAEREMSVTLRRSIMSDTTGDTPYLTGTLP